jgi:hypothetical protein
VDSLNKNGFTPLKIAAFGGQLVVIPTVAEEW